MAGWRGAFIGMMSLSWLAAAILAFERGDGGRGEPAKRSEPDAIPQLAGFRLLASPAIMLNFMFFVFLAFISYGLTNYLVVALGALHGTDFVLANTALSAFLMMTAVGVMAAGIRVDRIRRHAFIAVAGMTSLAAGSLAIALVDFGAVALTVIAGLVGLASGATYPSRDMLVREVTPPGEFGKVFGFVTAGINVAGIVAPFVYGAMMDHGNPRGVFLAIAAGGLLTVLLVGWSRRAKGR